MFAYPRLQPSDHSIKHCRGIECLLSVWQRCRSLCRWWHGRAGDPRQYVEVVDVQQSIRFYRWRRQRLASNSEAGCQADVSRRTSGRRNWPSASAWNALVPAAVWIMYCAACSLSALSFQIELSTVLLYGASANVSVSLLLLLLLFSSFCCTRYVSFTKAIVDCQLHLNTCILNAVRFITFDSCVFLFWKFTFIIAVEMACVLSGMLTFNHRTADDVFLHLKSILY